MTLTYVLFSALLSLAITSCQSRYDSGYSDGVEHLKKEINATYADNPISGFRFGYQPCTEECESRFLEINLNHESIEKSLWDLMQILRKELEDNQFNNRHMH